MRLISSPPLLYTFQVKRERDGKLLDLNSGTPWETLLLTTLARDRDLLVELLSEAKSVSMKTEEGKIVIYTAWGAEWKPFGQPRTKRPISSVVLDQGVKENLVGDIQDFMGRAKWYAERGKVISYSHYYCMGVDWDTPSFRHTLPARLSSSWATWLRKIIRNLCPCWSSQLSHLCSQPFRARFE